jgi:hypothetical protein
MFPAHWPLAIATLNLMALVLTAYLAMRLVHQITGRVVPVLLVFLLFATLGEQFYWVPYVVTDTTFQLLAFGVFILVCEAYRRAGAASRALWGLASIGAVLAVFYRPPGLLLPVWMVLVALTAGLWRERNQESRTARLRRYALWSVILLASGLLIQAFAMVQMGGLGPRGIPVVDYLRESLASGVVVDKQEDTFSDPPRSVLDFFLLMVKRLVYFFVFWAKAFSRIHTALNMVVFPPTYGLAAVGLYHSFTPTGRLSREAQRTAILAALFISGFAVFHALTLIDQGWRYRLPCYPPLIVLAALGIHCLLAAPTVWPRTGRPGRGETEPSDRTPARHTSSIGEA